MDFESFPALFKEELVAAVAAPLRSLLDDSPDLGPDPVCTWHESCRVVTLDLPPGFGVDDSLSSHITDQKQLWHHQVKVNGQPILYVRSIVEAETCRLVKLVRSPRAQQFDNTLGTLENLHLEGIARLMLIPRFNEEAFLVLQGQNIRGVVPLAGSEEWSSLATNQTILPPESVLGLLKPRPEFFGLRST
jgi:hypothetical protein